MLDRYRQWTCAILPVWVVCVLSLPPLSAAESDPHANLLGSIDMHTCLECHDGVVAQHMFDHPLDVDYVASFLYRGGKLRPTATLPSTIRLEAGRVVCTSCHNLSSTLPSKLSMSNAKSALCLGCHNR